MISQLAASGKFTEDELSKITDGIAMTATQYAIWHFSNYKAGDVPISIYYTDDDENVGRVPEELAYAPDLVFKVYDWLLDLDPVTAGETTADTIINDKNFITNLSATAVSKVEGHENNLDTNTENDAYIADLSFTMSVIPSTANGDDLVAKVMGPDNQVVAVGRIAGQLEEGEILLKDDGNGKYTFENVLLLEGVQNLNITLEGKQELKKGVYLYTSEVINGESSQTFVGVAEGTHKVDAEENWKVKFSVKDDEPERIIRINKNNIENSVGLEGIKFDFYFVADRNEYLSGAIVLPDAADYNYSGVPDYTVVTDANGYGEFNLTENNLPDGVYLVVENEHPAIVEPVAPFYVIMPATSEDGTHLEYEVNVYPKNQVRGDVIIEKDVIEIGNDESSEDAYSTHTWIIGTSIPADIGMGKYFEISDTLDNRLDFIGNLRVQVEDKSGAVVAAVLKENTDYILTVNDVNSLEENKPSDSFTVSLTPAGMLKIESVLSSGIERIRVYFDAEINANAEMAAEIPNQATLTYKNSVGMDFYAESDIPVVYTGAAKIIKVDSDNQSKVLAGAEFEVYRKATEAEIADENTEKVQLEGMDAPMVSVEFFADPTLQGEKVTKAVSDSEGMVYIYGLEYGTYYIKETKAPAGYNLLGEVKEIVINEVTHLDENTVTVLNKSGAVLPETGGIGTTWFIVTGAVLVLGAAIILITKKRVNG